MASRNAHLGNDARLMERALEAGNVKAALRRVKQNGGSPGIDGMTVEELPMWLVTGWGDVRELLLSGSYRPKPVREQQIPKSGGGVRKLGIPTVLDRLIQQCLLQVLQPGFDASFSQHSYGFRPGRSAHDAVCAAQRYIQEGRRVVVDVDLEKFFDRVHHDVLMGRMAKRLGDKRVLGLIRRYLEAGVMVNGVVVERYEGTPQGGPLSPLLANVLLDEVDKQLEKRGLCFVRYADDCNVYVRSKRAGQRVLQTLRELYARLRLRINEEKSAVDRPWNRKFLGYSFWVAPGRQVKRRVAPKALEAMKARVREITARNAGRSMAAVMRELKEYLTGWKQYFRRAETPGIFETLDQWVRRRLRQVQLKQWKRGTTIYRELRRRGAPEDVARQVAAISRCWWKNAGGKVQLALPTRYYDDLGVPRLAS
ncbi:group II intron reverse transcriptase/maturase [Myxococcus faecalis]|uniref:group II intron reverse transcriptase/maturase n=1 Tax=Myxococcus faecalis TaxID=3115646 RepID=UPI0024C6E6F0|nr:group II intron reverse transcriptase/maturase [Myxococcus sp. MH1]